MANILGLIPARGGSKGIPNKNIVDINGRPLISYTIEAALTCHTLEKIIVSTDNQEISQIAKSNGAEVPFMRPNELSTDTSTALDVFKHAIEFYANKDIHFDFIVYLQPTSPLRTSEDIDNAVNIMIQSNADTLVSVMDVPHQFGIDSQMYEEDGLVYPVKKTTPLTRQKKRSLLARNGPAILITKPETIKNYDSIYGHKTAFYKMSAKNSVDIDNLDDLEYVSWLLKPE